MQLLLRELDNRSVGACHTAAEALETLSGIRHSFDCSDPAQRPRANDFWARQIDTMQVP